MKPEEITPEQIKSIESAGYKYFFDKENYNADHPIGLHNELCAWAAHEIRTINVFDVLDIGSYLDFVSGMSCNMEVTMLDNRKVELHNTGIHHIIGDATQIPENDEMFDAVTSLSVIEHVGTCAFGDKLDVDADDKMISEAHRVLRPGGSFLLATQIAENDIFMVNCHRLYAKETLLKKLGKFFEVKTATVFKKENKGSGNHWDAVCLHCKK